jgi:uncharacterized membrane protein
VNRKALVLAGIFLAVALIVPPYVLIAEYDSDIDNLVNQAPNLADETQAPGIIGDVDQRSQTVFTIAIAVEVICVLLFAVCLWFALKP